MPGEKRKAANSSMLLISGALVCGTGSFPTTGDAQYRAEVCYEESQTYLERGCRIESNPSPMPGCSQGVVSIYCSSSETETKPLPAGTDDPSAGGNKRNPRRGKNKGNKTRQRD
jgi:hypothetical protein